MGIYHPKYLLVPVALLTCVILCWAPAVSGYELHLNCGSGEYVAGDGTVFETDRAYVPGDAGYVGGWNYAAWMLVGGTTEQGLYAWVRAELAEYRFDVPNDNYLVRLRHDDIFRHSTDENQFDVIIEGQEVLSDFDIYERVRGPYAIDCLFAVEVLDGQLNVEFTADHGYAVISAISVVSRATDLVTPATPQDVEALDSYGSVMLRWTPGDEDDLAGYIVERGSDVGGPFLPVFAPAGDIDRVPWRIDAVSPGETWYYRVVAVDAYGNQSVPSAVVSGTELGHASASLPQINVVIDPANLEILNDNPASDDCVPCGVVFDGVEAFPDALCRYRGNVTRSMFKKSWKVKLQAGEYDDRDNFNFNAEYPDKSLLRERVSYEVLRRNNNYAPLTRPVHCSVNAEWMGVYLDVENINRDFLRRVGLEDEPTEATVFKADSSASLTILPTVQDYMRCYEKELGDPEDYSDLINFIVDLNETPTAEKFNWLVRHVNLNRLLDFYSIEVVLQNNDVTYKNYFLHHDLNTDIWTVLPWDVDLTFGNTWPHEPDFVTNSPINLGHANRLFGLMSQQEILTQLHFDRIRQMLATSFAPAAIEGLVDSAYADVAYDGERDWWKWGWSSSDWFHPGPDTLRLFAAERAVYLDDQIALLEDPAALIINEVMASNNTTVTDEHGDYDDWVELMNRGNAPVALLGHYLTDNLASPNKLALPDTTLQPGEMLVVWCDAEPGEGPLHAPFKLDVDGEAVGIFTGAGNTDPPTDVRVFDAQFSDASYGRLPDGSAYWQILPTPTAGSANVGGGNIRPQIRDVTHFPNTPSTSQAVVVTARIFDDSVITDADLFYDAGGDYVILPLADDGLSGDGEADDGIYGGQIPAQPAPGEVFYYLTATDDEDSTTTEPPEAPAITYSYTVGYEAPPLYLNEFMADNATTEADEHGDFDDWVELYNQGPDAINLGGMYLTDNLSNPTRWQFPETLIEAGDFVLIWCDDEPGEGPLHTPFKLNSTDGEELGLFDSIVAGIGMVDTTYFPSQDPDISRGRSPDGGAWQIMAIATPGTTNNTIGIHTTPVAPLVLALWAPVPNPFNPFTRLEFELPAADRIRLQVVDVLGRQVRTLVDGPMPAGHHRIEWDGGDHRGRPLPSGVYWIWLASPAGDRVTRAVLIR